MMYIRSMIMVLVSSTHVIGQTLYDVSAYSNVPIPSGVAVHQPFSLSISAAGVGADGETTYVAVAVESAAYLVSIGSTTATLSTLSPEPSTIIATFVEGASGFAYTAGAPFAAVESCTFGKDALATCVDLDIVGTSTQTVTYSGSVFPALTLSPTGTAPASSGTSSAKTGGAEMPVVFLPLVVASVAGGLLLALC
ncbi:hypothetical protein B0H11DRAFT_2032055 [Mycena galericulata]|nr:hypothetical protein B0H11DRAFT_2032055 [Mycena galericulata]